MKFVKDFKEFAVKGNMMDMAIGIIIGASFNQVIDVLVKKVLLPPLSLLTEGVNFEDKLIILREAKLDTNGNLISDQVAIGYGEFLGTCLDFIIIGLTVFIVVKFLNSLKKKAENPNDMSLAPSKDIELLSRLTQLMEEQNQLLKQKRDD